MEEDAVSKFVIVYMKVTDISVVKDTIREPVMLDFKNDIFFHFQVSCCIHLKFIIVDMNVVDIASMEILICEGFGSVFRQVYHDPDARPVGTTSSNAAHGWYEC